MDVPVNTNGIRCTTMKSLDGEDVVKLSIFLNGVETTWVEFNHEQLTGLIAILQDRLDEITPRN